MRAGGVAQAEEGTLFPTRRKPTEDDQTKENQTDRQNNTEPGGGVPGWQRRTGAEKAAPITLE